MKEIAEWRLEIAEEKRSRNLTLTSHRTAGFSTSLAFRSASVEMTVAFRVREIPQPPAAYFPPAAPIAFPGGVDFSKTGRSSEISISVNLGRTTSRPCRVTM